MPLQLSIPDSVLQAIRLPEERLTRELLLELALALYAQGTLGFGKACQLANMDTYDFGQTLGQRGPARHYGPEELADDLQYARRR